ncbi:olfactory receptor 2A2-like [Sturnira hondurensis]|uniref:olfactory receptor 2A2-like n=1 Tax=Sturnira hondurensis TaxID=192404 RepID=UPI00187932A9|nr:olfactory receptor 2A2-like [Sturnira hondurensis]
MGGNLSWATEFVLLGFQLSSETEVLLFWVFSLFYTFSLLANGMIFALICLDQRLHTPMYFFLSHLAIIDISYASNNVPKMLANLVTQNRAISFVPCIMQTFLYLNLAATECLILVAMSYDRYVAICHPLHYTVIMSWTVCTVLATMCWLCGFFQALIHVLLLLRLPFCRSREVNQLFCELLSVLKLACADTWINKMVIFATSVLVLVGPLFLVLVSYMHILLAILKIKSGEGRKKAFSTCSSHLCVVGLFFGCAMVVYMVPDSTQRGEKNKILSLFYSLFNPMLNPLIYSLRNAQVKDAFCRALQVRSR